MASDAVDQLIQVIGQLVSPNQPDQLTASTNASGQADSILSIAANYAQTLGTLAGGEPYLALIALVVSFVLASTSSGQGQSAEQQVFQGLADAVNNSRDSYWQSKLGDIDAAWQNLGENLNDLAAQGIKGNYVVASAKDQNTDAGWHKSAQNFLMTFFPIQANGSPYGDTYWQRPFDESDPRQVFPGDTYCFSWYGTVPQPQGISGDAKDPRSMLPDVLLGFQSMLTLQMLVNFIDPSQPRFDVFLSQFEQELTSWLSWFYSQYALAVTGAVVDSRGNVTPNMTGTPPTDGIVKTDIPWDVDIMGGLYHLFNGPSGIQPNTSIVPDLGMANWGGSPAKDRYGWTGQKGYAWNWQYGAGETYPPYGIYPQVSAYTVKGFSPRTPLAGGGCCSPSYFVSGDHLADLLAQFVQGGILFGGQIYAGKLVSWVIPWTRNRIILGVMARWKALYIINGYDKVWSVIRKLNFIIKPDPNGLNGFTLPDPTTLWDGTIADGNWSARELFTVLDATGDLLDGVQIDDPANGPPRS